MQHTKGRRDNTQRRGGGGEKERSGRREGGSAGRAPFEGGLLNFQGHSREPHRAQKRESERKEANETGEGKGEERAQS